MGARFPRLSVLVLHLGRILPLDTCHVAGHRARVTGRRLLKRYLKETKQKVADLSRASGLDDGFLSRIVRGTRRPGLDNAAKLEEVTGGMVPATSWLKRTG